MWVWCRVCRRCYPPAERRIVDSAALCYYPDCSAPFAVAWPWERVRTYRPEYPVTPAYGVRYPLLWK